MLSKAVREWSQGPGIDSTIFWRVLFHMAEFVEFPEAYETLLRAEVGGLQTEFEASRTLHGGGLPTVWSCARSHIQLSVVDGIFSAGVKHFFGVLFFNHNLSFSRI